MASAADWTLYRSFLAVMREGSLSAAARALGLTQPSLGRHVAALEAQLGVTLFARSPRGLTPTELAHDLVPHAEAMAAAEASLRRVASGERDAVHGTVRITASEVIGGEVLPPILATARERHPGLVLELSLSNRAEDLLRRDADLAVRMVRPTQGPLVARLAGRVAVGLYAHHRYLERCGTPLRMDELAAHALIGFDHEPPYVRSMRPRHMQGVFMREHFALRTDSDLAALAALRAGFGIGFCQAGIAHRDPQLQPVLATQIRLYMEVWVVMHEDMRRTRRVRAMFDHLTDALAAYADAAD